MKIAMIGQKGIPAIHGGVERHVHELSMRLVKYGHEVTVYARFWYTKMNDTLISGVKVKHLWSINTKHLDTIIHTFIATIHAIWSGSDVIHYHGVGPSLWSWIPRIFSPKTTVITTFHCIDRKHEKWGLIARTALRLGEWTSCKFAHKTIAISRTIGQYTRDVYDTNSIYIPNGSNTLNLPKGSEKILDKFDLRPKEYIVLVSRFIQHKGIHTAIHAFNAISKEAKSVVGNKKLVIVGDGHHTSQYTKMLHEMAKQNPNIIFTGFQHGSDLIALMSNALALLHASLNEGLPLTVLEAMGLGLPVLLSDIPEHRELDVPTEFLYPTNELPALAGALIWLFQTNQKILENVGQNNRLIVEKNYNWDTIGSKTNLLYRDITSQHQIKKQVLDAEVTI